MNLRKRKPTFVLIIPRFEDFFHSFYAGEIIRGVSLTASRLNADFLIHVTDRRDHRAWLDSSLMDRRFIDGILFADIDNDLNIVKKVMKAAMPFVVLNNILRDSINFIAVDNKKAAVQIIDHFVALGHTNIATIAGDITTQAGAMRLEGFREGLLQHGIRVSRGNITYGDFLRTPARLAAERLLKLKPRPTAVFVASDVMALELIDAAKSKGISIPEELSIVGFDDNPILSASRVALSTVAQPLMEMGRLGAETLSQMSKGKVRTPVQIILPTKYIERETVIKQGAANAKDPQRD